MEISLYSHLDSITVIATKFCTWHDSCAVVACAKICCDLMTSNGVMARQSFHRIWIAGKKPLVKRAPEPLFTKRWDVLPPNLVKTRSREVGCYNDRVALKSDRHLGVNAIEMPVKFLSDRNSLNPNLAASRLHEILCQDVPPLSE